MYVVHYCREILQATQTIQRHCYHKIFLIKTRYIPLRDVDGVFPGEFFSSSSLPTHLHCSYPSAPRCSIKILRLSFLYFSIPLGMYVRPQCSFTG